MTIIGIGFLFLLKHNAANFKDRFIECMYVHVLQLCSMYVYTDQPSGLGAAFLVLQGMNVYHLANTNSAKFRGNYVLFQENLTNYVFTTNDITS